MNSYYKVAPDKTDLVHDLFHAGLFNIQASGFFPNKYFVLRFSYPELLDHIENLKCFKKEYWVLLLEQKYDEVQLKKILRYLSQLSNGQSGFVHIGSESGFLCYLGFLEFLSNSPLKASFRPNISKFASR